MVSIGEESIVSLVNENKLSDTIRNESQIYPQSYCGVTMDAVWNSLLMFLKFAAKKLSVNRVSRKKKETEGHKMGESQSGIDTTRVSTMLN